MYKTINSLEWILKITVGRDPRAPAFRLNPSLATSVVKSGWSHIIAGSRDNLQETSGKYMPCHPNINIYNPATYPTFCWCKYIVISFNNIIQKCRILTHPPFLGKPINLIFVNGKPWEGLSWLNAKQQVIEPIFTWALGPLGTRNNGVTVKIIAVSWHQHMKSLLFILLYIDLSRKYSDLELSWIIMVYLSRHWFMNSADLPNGAIQMIGSNTSRWCQSVSVCLADPWWFLAESGCLQKTSLNTDFPKNWQL